MLTDASNVTVLVDLLSETGAPTGHRAVYKPVRGERPLADFPPGSLAAREVGAYLVSAAGGWGLVPPTVLRQEGPLGAGSLQWWVDQTDDRLLDPSAGLVEVRRPDEVGEGWLPVVSGTDPEGEEVVVVHADDPALRSMALLDVVLNNADRKAAHLTLDCGGSLRGFDHGLCLHHEDKLRTVLWGWAGAPLRPEDQAVLEAVRQGLDGGDLQVALAALVSPAELEALGRRVTGLLERGSLPHPPPGRYPLPWPLW